MAKIPRQRGSGSYGGSGHSGSRFLSIRRGGSPSLGGGGTGRRPGCRFTVLFILACIGLAIGMAIGIRIVP